MASWYAIRARGTGAEVAIYDEIGAYGVSAKGFLAELGALPEGTPVDLRLNSPGGSVFDAVAIHNAIKRHEGTVTVWIDGIAASAASYIAMAGDEIVMPENAFLMIHDPAGLVMGTAEDMRAMAEALDKVKGSLVSGYAAKSGRTTEEVSGLMSAETWFDASDAVAQGFADRLIEPVRIAARFDIGRFRNAPPVLVEAVEADPDPATAPKSKRTRRPTATLKAISCLMPTTSRRPPRRASATSQFAAAERRAAGPRRDPVGGHRACPRGGRSLPPRGPAADGRPLPRRGREPRRGARCAPRSEGRGRARDRAPSPAARPLLGRAPLGRGRRPHLQAERMTP
jgi:ATP-dependent protease ClpP protease subunit